MARRDKEILLTLSAIGAAGLLVYFVNGPTASNIDSQVSQSRARRAIDDNFDSFCFDADCQQDDEDDVLIFQNDDCDDPAYNAANFAECNARKKGKGKGKGKGKKNNEPEVDYSNFWQNAEAQSQIDELNAKAEAALSKYHVKNPETALAAVSPDVTVRGFDSIELSGPTNDLFAANVDNGANDCSLDSADRVSSATQAVFFMFPQDMMYDSSVDQAALMAAYKSFGVSLGKYVNDGTKFVVGSYAATGRSSIVEASADSAGAAIDSLQTAFNVPVGMKKGAPAIKVSQLKAKSFLGAFTAPGIRNKYFRRSDDGVAQSCQAFVVFHGLPTDYKDFAAGEFDIDSFQKRCNIVPIFVQQSGMEPFYANWAATFRSASSMYSAAEEGFRGYVLTNPSDFAANADAMANQLTSFACACESRSACLLGKPAYVAAIEEEVALTTAATTTEGTTTTFYSTSVTTTTEFTTTADFRGVDESTEAIPVDMRCCGYSGDLSAAKYDQNRAFCCNDGESFYVSSEVC
jgi:hypothetical protein